MSFNIKPAKSEGARVLIGIGGAAGSGKTVSALRIATGITQKTGGKICVIDTENKRSLQYASDFSFDHIDFQPPFSSIRYLEAIQMADNAGYDFIIVDSTSHEHEGQGGHLEQHEAVLTRMAGDDYRKRATLQFSAWNEPKQDRRKLLLGIQRTKANIILCFRAKDKLELKKVNRNGRDVMEPTPAGYLPIGGEEFAYEADIMMMLPPNAKGKPDWEQPSARVNDMKGALTRTLHNTKQITEETGVAIYEAKCRKQPVAEKVTFQEEESNVTYSTVQEIIERIKMAGNLEVLQSTWKYYAADLKHISETSPDEYNSIIAAKDTKKAELTIATGA